MVDFTDKVTIENNIMEANLASPQISTTPDEQSILNIIDYIKAAELASGRFTDPDKVIRHYTHWACFDIAQALHIIYKNCDKQKVVRLSPSVAVGGYGRLPTCHYALAYDGHFYDILGKHTEQEIEDYCKHEFCWDGAKFNPLSEEEFGKYCIYPKPSFDNPVVAYCMKRILDRYPALAQNNTLTNN